VELKLHNQKRNLIFEARIKSIRKGNHIKTLNPKNKGKIKYKKREVGPLKIQLQNPHPVSLYTTTQAKLIQEYWPEHRIRLIHCFGVYSL